MKYPLGQKLYFSISEVAEITDLQPYILRTWEKEFACLRPKRLRGKNRAYRQRDINLILLIKRLLYEERFTIQGVRQKLKNDSELIKEAVGKEGPDADRGESAQALGAEDRAVPPDLIAVPPQAVDGSSRPSGTGWSEIDQQLIEEVKGQLKEILRLLS